MKRNKEETVFIPHYCPICGEIIGSNHTLFSSIAEKQEYTPPCPGKGKHTNPTESTRRVCLGLACQVTVTYPETNSWSKRIEYSGPRLKFFVWIVLMWFRNQPVFINGARCVWKHKNGLHRSGSENLWGNPEGEEYHGTTQSS